MESAAPRGPGIPPARQAGDVGQPVACPGSDQHSAGRDGLVVDLDAEQITVSFEGVDAGAGDLPTVGRVRSRV